MNYSIKSVLFFIASIALVLFSTFIAYMLRVQLGEASDAAFLADFIIPFLLPISVMILITEFWCAKFKDITYHFKHIFYATISVLVAFDLLLTMSRLLANEINLMNGGLFWLVFDCTFAHICYRYFIFFEEVNH